jgi:hypothetical protein
MVPLSDDGAGFSIFCCWLEPCDGAGFSFCWRVSADGGGGGGGAGFSIFCCWLESASFFLPKFSILFNATVFFGSIFKTFSKQFLALSWSASLYSDVPLPLSASMLFGSISRTLSKKISAFL